MLSIGDLTDKEKKVLDPIVTVLYLNDSSDYINGLWEALDEILELKHDDDVNIDKLFNELKSDC